MGNDDAKSVLRRKAATGRDAYRAKAMTLAKALRLTVAKVADDRFDMAMSMIGFTQETCSGETITDELNEAALLVLLDGPDRRMGAAVVESALVGGLIQQQTMGSVQPAIEGDEARVMTPTDAAICAPFIDDLLRRAAELPEDPQDRLLLSGFRFGARTEDLRLMSLALEAAEYEVIKMTFDIAGGRRQGEMTFILPNPEDEQPMILDAAEDDDAPAPVRSLEPIVLGLKADLQIALTKVEMPLSVAGRLAPGDVIDLGIETLDHVLVQTKEGRVLAQGNLGQSGGTRAVQIKHASAHGETPKRRGEDLQHIEQTAFDSTPIGGALLEGEAVDLGLPDKASESYELAEIPDLPDLPPLGDLPTLDKGGAVDGLPPLDLPDLSDLPELDGLPPLDLEAS